MARVNMTADLSQEIKSQVQAMLKKFGDDIASDAARLAPVRTGHLRSSISAEPAGADGTVTVRASAEYAAYVELGTRYMAAQPFLKPAVYTARTPA
jgi:HK97 gp10 family phage protein